MLCPKCNRNWTEMDIIKTNSVYVQNVPVEYDAYCPRCNIELGRVFWGKLTPNSQPEQAESTNVKHCPHCGKQLPEHL